MPKQTFTLTDNLITGFGLTLSVTSSNGEGLLPVVQLWSDSRFRVYLVTLKEGKLLSHRLSIFDEKKTAIEYCQTQIQAFHNYQKALNTNILGMELDQLRHRLDF